MTGRAYFRIFSRLLHWMALSFSLLPRFFCELLWGASNVLPGYLGIGLRYSLAKRLACEVGDNVFFGPSVTVRGWRALRIGNNVSIHRDCYLDASGGISIGSDVAIAHGCSVISFNHTWADSALPIKSNPLRHNPVRIDNDVWLGCGVRVLAGAQISCRTIVGAGSVVTGIFTGKEILAGIPARRIKEI